MDGNTVSADGTPDTAPSPTGTSVQMTTELTLSTQNGMYAAILNGGKTVFIAPWDLCAYYESTTHNQAGTSAAANAYGDGAVLDISSTGMNATSGMTYTITPQTTSNGVTYDKNVIGSYRYVPSGNDCDITDRGAVSGTVKFSDVDGSSVSGTIDAQVISYDPTKMPQGTLTGTFVAKKCNIPSTGQKTSSYNDEPDACHDAADQVSRMTSGGLHYK